MIEHLIFLFQQWVVTVTPRVFCTAVFVKAADFCKCIRIFIFLLGGIISLLCLIFLFSYFLLCFFGFHKIDQELKIPKKYCPNGMFLQRLLRSLALAADEEANRGFLNNNAEFFCLASIFLFILTLPESCNEEFKLDLVFMLIFTNFKLFFFLFHRAFKKTSCLLSISIRETLVQTDQIPQIATFIWIQVILYRSFNKKNRFKNLRGYFSTMIVI